MGFCVCMGAVINCSFGAAPGTLNVTPENKTMTVTPIATIMDYIPLKNILPFGVCSSLANPTVAAATAAALGVLTPMPCIPNIVSPWVPGSPAVLIGNKPALNSDSQVMCLWGGVVKIINPGTTNIQW